MHDYKVFVRTETFTDRDDSEPRELVVELYSDSGSGVPLSDGSVLTVEHLRSALLSSRYFVIDGRSYEPAQSATLTNDLDFKRYDTMPDGEARSDGLFRFTVPETKLFPRSFEFDPRQNPRRLTNEEFNERYPPGTPVTISGHIRYNSADDLPARVEVISPPQEDDFFVLQRITTSIASRDWFDWLPYDHPDFLYLPVPGDLELAGMSGGPVTVTDNEGIEHLIGVSFLKTRMPMRLFGEYRFLGLYGYPWCDTDTTQVLIAFRWPYESAVINSRQHRSDTVG